MARMFTTRGYWVDWICVFDKQPSAKEIINKEKFLVDYLKKYLGNLAKTKAGEIFEYWYEEKLIWVQFDPKKINKINGLTAYDKLSIQEQLSRKAVTNWINILKWEREQICSKPMIFNFKAYFEDNSHRYTLDVRGSMTPPPPPPPPGS